MSSTMRDGLIYSYALFNPPAQPQPSGILENIKYTLCGALLPSLRLAIQGWLCLLIRAALDPRTLGTSTDQISSQSKRR